MQGGQHPHYELCTVHIYSIVDKTNPVQPAYDLDNILMLPNVTNWFTFFDHKKCHKYSKKYTLIRLFVRMTERIVVTNHQQVMLLKVSI